MYRVIFLKIKYVFEYVKMRWFSSTEDFIKWYLYEKGGSFKLKDDTWIVHQSDDFHKYCYGTAYKKWKDDAKD